jgi:hypothetical protein
LFRIKAMLLVAVALGVTVPPLAAEAQGWRWIRELSGPEYPFVPTVRFRVCLRFEGGVRISCGEIAGALREEMLPSAESLPVTELQIGTTVGYSFGVDGDNSESDIANTSVFVIDVPEVRLMWLSARDRALAVAPVVGISYGLSRFSGGTIPETFWQSSWAITAGLRYPNPLNQDPGSRHPFIEGGMKLRRYFPAISNADFGATDPPADLDPWGQEYYIEVGFRWGFLGR